MTGLEEKVRLEGLREGMRTWAGPLKTESPFLELLLQINSAEVLWRIVDKNNCTHFSKVKEATNLQLDLFARENQREKMSILISMHKS
jgi:hypothetical protein